MARRIDSPHVLKPCLLQRKRNFLYVATEYIDGQTLTQWMIDNPKPSLETVRGIVEQIAKGLRAFHRKEMLHQDIRPDNIMIDATGTVKIIDFGSTKITGVVEAEPSGMRNDILGTQQYTAPEYFLGEPATSRSDLFSLGVITYQMLTGKLPYGAQIANARTRSQFNRLVYRPASHGDREVPQWIDGTLEKAVHPNPYKRYDSFSEFLFDLRHPNANYLSTSSTPLIERNPLLFWKSTTDRAGAGRDRAARHAARDASVGSSCPARGSARSAAPHEPGLQRGIHGPRDSESFHAARRGALRSVRANAASD